MPSVIIVGLPVGHAKRLAAGIRNEKGAFRDEWQVQYVNSARNGPEIQPKQVAEALTAASAYEHAHVVAVSKQDGSIRQAIANQIRRYFRFRWMKNELLNSISGDVARFFEEFNRLLQEEERWLSLVKPTDLYSPLLLPQDCFAAHEKCRRLWDMAEQYGDIDNIVAAGGAVETFKNTHWTQLAPVGHYGRSRTWIDQEGQVFAVDENRHGVAPFPRGWKYSYRIEDGFHFDVSSSNERAFTFIDCTRKAYSVPRAGHVNVDPHGHVRAPTA